MTGREEILNLQEKYVDAAGCRFGYVEQGRAKANQPTLFFVHATGFHSRLWDFHMRALASYHCIALDLRGHGRSDNLAVDHWRTFSEDVAAVVAALGLTHVIGIGHSMGAHALLEAAAGSDAFASLLLLDPTVLSPDKYEVPATQLESGALHPAAKRRNRFESAQHMQDTLREKSSFPLFHPEIFADYCDYGVEAHPGGGDKLCCEPVVEAHVYMAATSNPGVLAAAATLEVPVTIVRAKAPQGEAEMDWASSPTWPGLVGVLPNAVEHHWPECTHFIPMQKPLEVIALIQAEIKAWKQSC